MKAEYTVQWSFSHEGTFGSGLEEVWSSSSLQGIVLMDESRELRISIADIVISMIVDSKLTFSEVIERFAVFNSEPEVSLRVHCGELPEIDDAELIFDSQHEWALFQSGGKYVVRYNAPFSQLAVLEPDFTSGHIYFSRPPYLLFRHRFLSMVVMRLLSLRRGMGIHACGINYNGQGIIFTGHSEAGKSTMANLWEGINGATVLSDECVIVRKRDDGFWVYGTPWAGVDRFSSPQSVPLNRIFFIRHSQHNIITPKQGSEAIAAMFARTYPPFYDPSGVKFLLDMCSHLTCSVPCYDLGFVPDQSVVDAIRAMDDGL